MKLYLKKSDCTFRDSVNGEVLEVETDEVMFFEDNGGWFLVPTEYDEEFSHSNKVPYVCTAPKEFKI